MDLSESQKSDKMMTAQNCLILGQMELIEYDDTPASLVIPVRKWEDVARCVSTPRFPWQFHGVSDLVLHVLSQAKGGGNQALTGTGEEAE